MQIRASYRGQLISYMRCIMSNYYILPSEILGDPNLNQGDKLLLAVIFSLSGLRGHCFATNAKLAGILGSSQRTVSRSINSLKDKNILSIEMIQDSQTKEILERKIWIKDHYILKFTTSHQKHLPPVDNRSRDSRQNTPDPIDTRSRDSHQKPRDPLAKVANIDNNLINNLDNNLINKIEKAHTNKKPQSKYKTFKASDFDLPPKWGEKSTQALADWVEYKTASGTPKLLASYQAEVALYGDNPQLFTQLVTRAKIRGWKGLNEDIPLEQSSGSFVSNRKPFESKHEENVRLGMEALHRFANSED